MVLARTRGGSVNLRTTTVDEQPTVSLYGLGRYTPIIRSCGFTQFRRTFCQRFGKEKKLALLFGGA